MFVLENLIRGFDWSKIASLSFCTKPDFYNIMLNRTKILHLVFNFINDYRNMKKVCCPDKMRI